jgi:acetylornithine deacetylase/succinyl-diaminopimelate desuccinylase-like protein
MDPLMKKQFLWISLLLSIVTAQFGKLSDYQTHVWDYTPRALETLNTFLKLPNGSRDQNNIERNVEWCVRRFSDIGFNVNTYRINCTPFVLATNIVDKMKPTVLVYLQIDGQPVDPSKWDQNNPYIPQVKRVVENQHKSISWVEFMKDPRKSDKIFARSSSDSKGPAVSFISALEILRKENKTIPYNLKVIMDFQEEISSPDIHQLVQKEKKALSADYLLIMDGSRFTLNEPTLTFGARGIAKMTLTVFGPKSAIHSGQYGNFIPNPVFKASQLFAAMKDENGRVLIPGWYDNIQFSITELKMMNEVSTDAKDLANEMGVATWESVGNTYQEALQYPTLNISGIKSGWVGAEVRTIIPDKVVIEMDIRLTPESDGDKMIQMVRTFISSKGFQILDHDPEFAERIQYPNLIKVESSVGYPAFQTPLNSKIGEWLTLAHENAIGKIPLKMRRTGGSQPMAPFVRILNIPAVAVRIPNPDNNIHGPNENISVGNFLEGIQINLGILTTPINNKN